MSNISRRLQFFMIIYLLLGWAVLTLSLTGCNTGVKYIQGPKGETGAPGQDGRDGIDGRDGSNGSSCSIATIEKGNVAVPSGGALITCPDGTSSIITNGTDGVPGTIITPVQFCKNFRALYPSAFPESGLCINNRMFGVFSENGGYLAEMANGTYYSNGRHSTCVFTLKDNCQVVP